MELGARATEAHVLFTTLETCLIARVSYLYTLPIWRKKVKHLGNNGRIVVKICDF